MTTLVEHFDAAITALEAQDIEGAKQARADASKAGTSSDHAALRYLDFMFEWLDGDELDEEQVMDSLGSAEALLDDAVALDEAKLAARIVLDLADILTSVGMVDEAEHALRGLGERSDLDPNDAFEALAARVEIVLDFHEDPEQAGEILAGVAESFRTDPRYISLQASVLMELDKGEEALEMLREAVAAGGDAELRYQLGVMLRAAGKPDEAIDHLLAVRTRDLVVHEVDADAAVGTDQAAELGRMLEEVIDTLPDPVIKRVASAAIRVERWASEAAIRAGADPRGTVHFEGQPDREGAEDGHVDAIVIHYDVVLVQIDDDEDIVEQLALGLVEEFDRFFDLELIPGM